MAKFTLFNQELVLPDSCIRANIIYRLKMAAVDKAKVDFYEWYKGCLGINDVLKNYEEMVYDIILDNFYPLFSELEELEIYDVSKEMYFDRCIDYGAIDYAIEEIADRLEEIIDDKNAMKQYRAARKANRGRFVGGGFGISGAIKGSMKAGAMNATTGLAHGAVNTIGNIGSSIAASVKTTALFMSNDTKETLFDGVESVVMRLYERHMYLVNEHIRGYYEWDFVWDRAEALYKNALKIPEKREQLLFEAVEQYPREDILHYIFLNYPSERKAVYQIGEELMYDFGKYVEEAFAKSYADVSKEDTDKVEEVKAYIINTMKDFGIVKSETLVQLNKDVLTRIIGGYLFSPEEGTNDKLLQEFEKYDAPKKIKQSVAHDMLIWELGVKYGVEFTDKEKELILATYYYDDAKNNEDEAIKVKKKMRQVMDALLIKESAAFDQLENDCLQRLCNGVEEMDEDSCNQLKAAVTSYDALDKNKEKFFGAIQKRIEDIWSKEDGEIFDNVYMNTDLYNHEQINESLAFIKEKGRTSSSEKYIKALESCNEKNIKKAKKYQKKSSKVFNVIGIILLLLGGACTFLLPPCIVIAIPGIVLMVRYSSKKKMYKLLTINETQFHKMVMVEETIEGNEVVQNDEVQREEVIDKCVEVEQIAEQTTEQTTEQIINENVVSEEVSGKKADKRALISLITGIATFPLVFTVVLWIPSIIVSLVFGIYALKHNTNKKGIAITGIVFSGVFIALFGLALLGY